MADQRSKRVDVYCEDEAHEAFVGALIKRLANEAGLLVDVRLQCGRGGASRALEELKVWQRLQSNRLEAGIPDLLVVTIDANSYGPHGRAQQIERVLDRSLFPQAVLGCPDPYIERWAMADPAAFTEVVGCAPPPEPERKSRGLYKDLLHNTMAAANFPVLTTPMQEVAADIVSAMDPYRAGKRRPELGRFISDLRGALALA